MEEVHPLVAYWMSGDVQLAGDNNHLVILYVYYRTRNRFKGLAAYDAGSTVHSISSEPRKFPRHHSRYSVVLNYMLYCIYFEQLPEEQEQPFKCVTAIYFNPLFCVFHSAVFFFSFLFGFSQKKEEEGNVIMSRL
jgi:hypothetical protein